MLLGTPDFHLSLLVFCASLFIYNIDRLFTYSSDFSNSPQRSEYINQNLLLIMATILICLAGLGVLLKYFTYNFLLFMFVLLILTILYLLLFNKETEKIRSLYGKKQDPEKLPKLDIRDSAYLRDKFSGLKPLILAFVWAATTIILPVIHSTKTVIPGFYILFLIRFLEYGVNGVLFDFRDIAGDTENQKSNIFQKKNRQSILNFTLMVLVINSLIIVISVYKHILPFIILSDLTIVCIYFLIIWSIIKSNPKKARPQYVSSLYYPLLVDGVLFLPAVAMLWFYKIA